MRAFLACFLALAACSSDSDNTTNPPPPGDDMPPDGSDMPPPTTDPSLRQDYDDTATIVASHLNLAEIGAMKASVDLSYGRVPAGMAEDVAGGLVSGNGSVSGSIAGLAYSLAFECHDAAHVAVPCNGAEDHVRVVVKYSGATSGANMSMDGINEKGVFYVRNIALGTPMYGGTGQNAFTSTLSTGVYTVSYQESSLHLLFDPVTPVLPASGTYDLTLTMHRSGREGVEDRDFNVSAHLDVTGADAAVLTLDNQEVYNLTLSTGVAVHQ
jgi:hypothetical protein